MRQRKKALGPLRKANPHRTYKILKPAELVGKGPGTHYHEKADLSGLTPEARWVAENGWSGKQ